MAGSALGGSATYWNPGEAGAEEDLSPPSVAANRRRPSRGQEAAPRRRDGGHALVATEDDEAVRCDEARERVQVQALAQGRRAARAAAVPVI